MRIFPFQLAFSFERKKTKAIRFWMNRLVTDLLFDVQSSLFVTNVKSIALTEL